MAVAEQALSGRRGWAVVTTLSMVLTLLVVDQLPGRPGDVAAASSLEATVPVAVQRVLDVRDRPLPRPEPAQPAQPAQPAEPAPAAAPPAPVAPPAAEAAAPAALPAVAAAPAAAPAPTPAPPAPAADLCSGPGWEQRRGQAALASLRAGAERTGFSVTFAGARKGYMGLTHLREARIDMFVRSCDAQSEDLLRHVMAHELGHAYDTTHMTAAARAAWQQARGISASTPWYGCSGCSDFATPAGDFAEVYAQWVRGADSNKSQLSGAPGPQALAALAAQFFGA